MQFTLSSILGSRAQFYTSGNVYLITTAKFIRNSYWRNEMPLENCIQELATYVFISEYMCSCASEYM